MYQVFFLLGKLVAITAVLAYKLASWGGRKVARYLVRRLTRPVVQASFQESCPTLKPEFVQACQVTREQKQHQAVLALVITQGFSVR